MCLSCSSGTLASIQWLFQGNETASSVQIHAILFFQAFFPLTLVRFFLMTGHRRSGFGDGS